MAFKVRTALTDWPAAVAWVVRAAPGGPQVAVATAETGVPVPREATAATERKVAMLN
ncbi:hypothetical protein LJN55_05330 [Erwinia rhapontici]|nr:hypothetical protein LJN55_05330 [Erwinia rhapontici]